MTNKYTFSSDAATEFRGSKQKNSQPLSVHEAEAELLSNLRLCAQFAEIAHLQSEAFDRDGLVVTTEKFFANGRLAHAALGKLRNAVMEAAKTPDPEDEDK